MFIYLSVYLQAWKRSYSATPLHFWTWQHLRDFLNFWSWQNQQWNNSASFFEFDNIKNKWILRDLLQKWKVECRADGVVPMRFAIFPLHLSKGLRLARKSDARSAATQNHLGKLEGLMLQNATLLRKSAPWPPNISDGHVSCTAPATRNCKFPTPAIVFETATKPSRLLTFDQVHNPLAPATRNDIWTSKSAPKRSFFTLLTWKCASRQNGVHFFDISTSKRPKVVQESSVFNILTSKCACATTACTFSTSQLPKVVQAWCVLYILTSTCASRHNGVQFFISHLASWLCTRRFSEPTFRPSRATNHRKNTVFRDFRTFSRTHLHLLSSDFFSSLIVSLLLFSSLTHPTSAFPFFHIVRSLTSKLPSISLGACPYGIDGSKWMLYWTAGANRSIG